MLPCVPSCKAQVRHRRLEIGISSLVHRGQPLSPMKQLVMERVWSDFIWSVPSRRQIPQSTDDLDGVRLSSFTLLTLSSFS